MHGIVTGLKNGVSVYSDPGKQTTFQISLPVVRAWEDAVQNKRYQEPPQKNERLLFVDEEELPDDATKPILKDIGYQVTDMTNRSICLENASQLAGFSKSRLYALGSLFILLPEGHSPLVSTALALKPGYLI
ncbi:MAG: hypothetical protein MI799_07440 [Desulfobacterales bacterium]|nr:hypothetical protein [Desulfobacterales bacterium]